MKMEIQEIVSRAGHGERLSSPWVLVVVARSFLGVLSLELDLDYQISPYELPF